MLNVYFYSFFFVFFFHPFFHLNYRTEDSNLFYSSQHSISPNNFAIAPADVVVGSRVQTLLRRPGPPDGDDNIQLLVNSSTNLQLKASPRTTMQTGYRPRLPLAASALRRTLTIAKRTFIISFLHFSLFVFSYLNHQGDDSNLFSSSQPSVTHENLYHRSPGDAAGGSRTPSSQPTPLAQSTRRWRQRCFEPGSRTMRRTGYR